MFLLNFFRWCAHPIHAAIKCVSGGLRWTEWTQISRWTGFHLNENVLNQIQSCCTGQYGYVRVGQCVSFAHSVHDPLLFRAPVTCLHQLVSQCPFRTSFTVVFKHVTCMQLGRLTAQILPGASTFLQTAAPSLHPQLMLNYTHTVICTIVFSIIRLVLTVLILNVLWDSKQSLLLSVLLAVFLAVVSVVSMVTQQAVVASWKSWPIINWILN